MSAYAIRLHDNGTWATSRDIPEFNTTGDDASDTINNAVDGIITALSFYQDRRLKMPESSAAGHDEVVVHLPALESAKIQLWDEMIDQGVSRADLSKLLGISTTAAGRLSNILHTSRIEHVERALLALGKRLSVATEAA